MIIEIRPTMTALFLPEDRHLYVDGVFYDVFHSERDAKLAAEKLIAANSGIGTVNFTQGTGAPEKASANTMMIEIRPAKSSYHPDGHLMYVDGTFYGACFSESEAKLAAEKLIATNSGIGTVNFTQGTGVPEKASANTMKADSARAEALGIDVEWALSQAQTIVDLGQYAGVSVQSVYAMCFVLHDSCKAALPASQIAELDNVLGRMAETVREDMLAEKQGSAAPAKPAT